eukprot:Clim_evm71s156 gene=Clim_evmTU71s156
MSVKTLPRSNSAEPSGKTEDGNMILSSVDHNNRPMLHVPVYGEENDVDAGLDEALAAKTKPSSTGAPKPRPDEPRQGSLDTGLRPLARRTSTTSLPGTESQHLDLPEEDNTFKRTISGSGLSRIASPFLRATEAIRSAFRATQHLDIFGVEPAGWDLDLGEDFLAPRAKKFIGTYTEADCDTILERNGLTTILPTMGFAPKWKVKLDTKDTFVHKMWLYVWKEEDDDKPEGERELYEIMEIFLRRMYSISNFKTLHQHNSRNPGQRLIPELVARQDLDIIVIEWMRMQNPTISWDKFPYKPFPGQEHPPLGIGKHVDKMITRLAMDSNRDALVNVPLYYHNAVLYARSYKFMDATTEGSFQSLLADLKEDQKEHGLSAVARAWQLGLVRHRPTNRVLKWVAEEMILPVSDTFKAFFENPKWKDIMEDNVSTGLFYIDWGGDLPSEQEWERSIPFTKLHHFTWKKRSDDINCLGN